MAKIPGSVPFTGLVAPTDTTDTYPVVDPLYGIDGLRSVPTMVERDAITPQRRRFGMIVFVQSPASYWRLESDLTTWSAYGIPSYATFVLGYNTDVSIGIDKTNHYIIPRPSNIIKIFMSAKMPPIGDDILIDIRLNNISLWSDNPSNRPRILDGTSKSSQSIFDTLIANEGDELSIDVISVGSTQAGSNVTVQLLMLS